MSELEKTNTQEKIDIDEEEKIPIVQKIDERKILNKANKIEEIDEEERIPIVEKIDDKKIMNKLKEKNIKPNVTKAEEKTAEDKFLKGEKFKIIEFVKKLANYIDAYITNFPNKELELKRKLRDTAYDLVLITYEANVTTDLVKRQDLIEKAVAHIKFLDFIINQCYEKKIINSKRYFKFGESLDNIVKYFAGWYNMTKSEIGKSPS